jgi:hypothetical protein
VYSPLSTHTLGRDKINAIWKEHAFSTTLKVYQSHKAGSGMPAQSDNGNGCLVWFYQKMKYGNSYDSTSDTSFDLWLAIRDTRQWGGPIEGGDAVGASDSWKGAYKHACWSTTNNYNQDTNQISSSALSYMKYWEIYDHVGSDGNTYKTSRHGMPGDPDSGCVWTHIFNNGADGTPSSGHCSSGGIEIRYLK